MKNDIFIVIRASHSEWYNSCFWDDKTFSKYHYPQLFCPSDERVTITTFISQTFSSAFFLVFYIEWDLSHSTVLIENHLYKIRDKFSVHLTQTRMAFTYHSDLEGLDSTFASCSPGTSSHFWRFRASHRELPAAWTRGRLGLSPSNGLSTVVGTQMPLLQPGHWAEGTESLSGLQ